MQLRPLSSLLGIVVSLCTEEAVVTHALGQALVRFSADTVFVRAVGQLREARSVWDSRNQWVLSHEKCTRCRSASTRTIAETRQLRLSFCTAGTTQHHDSQDLGDSRRQHHGEYDPRLQPELAAVVPCGALLLRRPTTLSFLPQDGLLAIEFALENFAKGTTPLQTRDRASPVPDPPATCVTCIEE